MFSTQKDINAIVKVISIECLSSYFHDFVYSHQSCCCCCSNAIVNGPHTPIKATFSERMQSAQTLVPIFMSNSTNSFLKKQIHIHTRINPMANACFIIISKHFVVVLVVRFVHFDFLMRSFCVNIPVCFPFFPFFQRFEIFFSYFFLLLRICGWLFDVAHSFVAMMQTHQMEFLRLNGPFVGILPFIWISNVSLTAADARISFHLVLYYSLEILLRCIHHSKTDFTI